MRVLLHHAIIITALLAAACHKTETPKTAASETNTAAMEAETPPDADAAAQPLPPPPPPSPSVVARAQNVVRQNVVGEVDAFLTAELRNFVEQKKRMPQTFSEFATVRLDTVPRPPRGKKWAIDNETLEVKAVDSQ